MKIYKAKANKDYPDDLIAKGDEYFYCEPQRRKTGGVRKIRSTSRPFIENWIKTYMQRFRGEFATKLDEFNNQYWKLQYESEKDDLLIAIDEYIEEKKESLENVPYQLQESHVLNEQIEQLEQLRDEVNQVDELYNED